jgi:hypothetical protein
MKDEGIHRVAVPGNAFTAIIIVAMIVWLLALWPDLKWVALGSAGLGLALAGGLILKHRRSRNPPAARLTFPPDRG